MGILKKTLPLALIIPLAGCYEDFDPHIDSTPVLCLNALITSGKPVDVSVSRTWLYTDTASERNHSVDDAIVTLYANGMPAGDGFIPREGDHIRIAADSPAYGHAEAEVDVPLSIPVEITELDVEPEYLGEYYYYEYPDGYDPSENGYYPFPDEEDIPDNWEIVRYHKYKVNMKAKVRIHDQAGIENFYIFGCREWNPCGKQPFRFSNGELFYEMEPIFGEHLTLTDDLEGNYTSNTTFFSDRQFADKDYTLNIRIERMTVEISTEFTPEELMTSGLEMAVYPISKSLYSWYLYSWYDYNGLQGWMSEIGFADPISGYSNVSTGAGVVGAQTVSHVIIPGASFIKPSINISSTR